MLFIYNIFKDGIINFRHVFKYNILELFCKRYSVNFYKVLKREVKIQ